jgi:nucleoside diphosphate kinase
VTEPLSNIDRYPDVSAEIGNFLESLTDEDRKSLNQITFAIFGPEVILGGEYAEMLKQIYAAGLFVVVFRIALLSEEEIESLYKYHVPDSLLSALETSATGKDYAFLLKTVPVRNWRLLRRRYALGPSLVAMLRKPGGSASAALSAVKGPSDAVDLESGYLRSGNDNPCFCGIHSSDDSVSVVREGLASKGRVFTLDNITNRNHVWQCPKLRCVP